MEPELSNSRCLTTKPLGELKMKRNVLMAGIWGGLVVSVWLVISNAILPFKSDMIHKVIPNQLEVHAVLKENITVEGTYACPYLGPADEALFEDYRNEPVYSITYSGYTHGSGSLWTSLAPIPIPFIVTIVVAWLLSATSGEFRASFIRRVLFVAAVGLIIALYEDVLQISFGPQNANYLLFLAVNNVITWTLAGLVIARRIRAENHS
jgi:hypothetical protein